MDTPVWLGQVGDVALFIITLAVMLIGLAGLIVPILPGLVIIWLAGLVFFIISGFNTAAWIILAVMTILMLVGNLMDNFIMGASAHQQGASWLTILVALVLGIVGSILLPPFGGLLAALLGIFILEFIRQKDWRKALDSTKGMALGCGWSSVARGGIGLLLIGLWLLWVLAFQTPA